ncbi:tetratricopeptide repeat protein [Winogradskyella wichelsiae]|uniref:tetratricopeptide repeat protein n=1 Tax=Winogradskyella wichelsiae TaxID=2697007 RepID=UPI003EF4B313
MEEQDYIQFESYLLGDLSKDESIVFEEKLKTDVSFKQAFEIYKDMSSHLKHEIENEQENSDFKANLDVISNMYFNKLEKDKTIEQPSHKFNFYKYGIAASVIILIGFFVFNQFSDPTYEDYNSFNTISLTVRSGENEAMTKAEHSFNSKDYKEAIIAFNEILENDYSNLEIQLYKSIALVETNQFQEADELLLKLSQGNSAYQDNAKWILALSYLKQEKITAVVETLKTISQNSEHYKVAQELLNQLD